MQIQCKRTFNTHSGNLSIRTEKDVHFATIKPKAMKGFENALLQVKSLHTNTLSNFVKKQLITWPKRQKEETENPATTPRLMCNRVKHFHNKLGVNSQTNVRSRVNKCRYQILYPSQCLNHDRGSLISVTDRVSVCSQQRWGKSGLDFDFSHEPISSGTHPDYTTQMPLSPRQVLIH